MSSNGTESTAQAAASSKREDKASALKAKILWHAPGRGWVAEGAALALALPKVFSCIGVGKQAIHSSGCQKCVNDYPTHTMQELLHYTEQDLTEQPIQP